MSEIITKSEPDSGFARIVGRIVNEYLGRRAEGDRVTADDLFASHPELADELREHLEVLGELRPSEARINDLIERGALHPASDSRYAAELGPYKITACLARGGMGMVFKAYEESLDRPIALKILRSELSDDEAGAMTKPAVPGREIGR